jgi:hypothetical protein
LRKTVAETNSNFVFECTNLIEMRDLSQTEPLPKKALFEMTHGLCSCHSEQSEESFSILRIMVIENEPLPLPTLDIKSPFISWQHYRACGGSNPRRRGLHLGSVGVDGASSLVRRRTARLKR